MKKLILLMLSALMISSCSQEKKLLRRAAASVEQSNFEKAISYYDQILKKDKDSYFGNAGKGVVLSEYLSQYEKAIPYLEKAVENSPKKTSMKLNYDLGKSYHHIGNYERALYFYSRAIPYNNEDNPDYDAFLTKRVADCKYALAHPEVNSTQEQWVKNVGKPLNTEMPEYSPVAVGDGIIFTSQRQDDPKEKKNGVDGKYFEKMYLCKVKDGVCQPATRYMIPGYDKNDKFNKTNESVISASADNKKLYLYRDGKIYESDLTDPSKAAVKMNDQINFSYLQNHACVSSDGKTILFTSESDKGIGGTDIYMAKRNEEGDWSPPELISVNTLYNEDSPYLSEDGTLFFSSNGLPGYGGYDVYKTRFMDGKWSTPENLGQPINSPGDDIYFALKPGSPDGYYASSRSGGYGDMDIYQVHYVLPSIKECTGNTQDLIVSASPIQDNNLKYTVSLQSPESYNSKVRNVNWTVNNSAIDQTSTKFDHTFDAPGTYTVGMRAVVYCDTCPSLVAICNEKIINVGEVPLVTNDSDKNKVEKDVNVSPKKDKIAKNDKEANTKKSKGTTYMSNEELTALNWNTNPVYFEFNQSEITQDAMKLLEQNADVIRNNKNLSVIINGYADSRGSNAYNKSLSAKRAQAIKTYFLNLGIAQSRIASVNSFGESQLVNNCDDDSNCSEEEHAQNRRAEFKVINKGERSPITLK